MKKLDDIPKKDIFKVPDGYFEELPGIIQSRVTARQDTRQTAPVARFALRYALPFVAIAAVALFWFQRDGSTESPESVIAGIETADLVAYIGDTDLTTDELLDDVTFYQVDADGIEDAVFSLELDEKTFGEIIDEVN